MKREFRNLSRRSYELKQDELAAAKRSLYYWWWRYLRLSVDYWWLCQQNGKTRDKTFAKTYSDFGDVFDVYSDFDTWWEANGTRLFAYQITPPKVDYYSEDEFLLRRRENWYHQILVPKFFTKTEILKQIDTLFEGFKPQPFPEELRAIRTVAPLQGVRKSVLIEVHKTWCLNDAIRRAKIAGALINPMRYTQYWMGNALDLRGSESKVKRYSKSQADYENLAMRVKVNRYLSRADMLIKNVEVGIFPSVKPVETRQYWTRKQQMEMQLAVDAGHWISPESRTSGIRKLLGISIEGDDEADNC